MKCGPVAGNIFRLPLADLVGEVEGLVSGPPCPPWSSIGARLGSADARSSVFERVVAWIACLN
eukprot:5453588-Alexandrium_andersonii.AAC.1